MFMRRRARTASGILASTAMILSLTEVALAAICAPMDSMASMGRNLASMDMDMRSDMPAMGMNTEAVSVSERPDDRSGLDRRMTEGENETGCPLLPMMGGGCAAPALVGASSPAFAALTAKSGQASLGGTRRPTSHPPDPLFHPPRA